MFVCRSGPAGAAAALALLLAQPALSLTPKEAWSDLRNAARDAGFLITSQSVDDLGDALVVHGLRLDPLTGAQDFELRLGSLRVEPRGESVALLPSDPLQVYGSLGGVRRLFDLHPQGEVVVFHDEEHATLDFAFASLGLELVHSAQRGPVPQTQDQLDVTFDGLEAQLRATREGTSVFTLEAAGLRYAFDMRAGPQPGNQAPRQSGEGTMEGLRFSFEGAQLAQGGQDDLAAAFAAGFAAQIALHVEAASGTSRQDLGGQAFVTTSEGGASSLEASLAEGRFEIASEAGASRYEFELGAIRGDAPVEGARVSFGMPVVPTPGDQRFHLGFHIDGLAPSDALLTSLGATPFLGQSADLALEISAEGRLLQSLGAPASQMPLEMSSASLDALRLRLGDSTLTGSGALRLIGGLAGQIGRQRPEAEGDFTFELIGGEAVLGGLTQMGVVPPDQLFFVRMMMSLLGRAVGEDHLVSEIALRPGGQILVNGALLPF